MTEKIKNEDIAHELKEMLKADQSMRRQVSEGTSLWDYELGRNHMRRLRAIVAERGSWPMISDVGKQASMAAWCLIQHGDRVTDIDFMSECLSLMKALPAGEIAHKNIAYLEDRLHMYWNEPQVYGTQFQKKGGNLEMYELADPQNVQERRDAMGISWTVADDFIRLQQRDVQ